VNCAHTRIADVFSEGSSVISAVKYSTHQKKTEVISIALPKLPEDVCIRRYNSMDGWMDGWTDEWMVGWTRGRADRRNDR
jgi:hypothetical protein